MENLELKGLHVDELQKLRVMDSELAAQVTLAWKCPRVATSPFSSTFFLSTPNPDFVYVDDSFEKRMWRLRWADRRFSEDDGRFHRTLRRGDR